MIVERFPGIKRAVLELAYANNAIGNPRHGGMTEYEVLADTEEVLGAEGVYEEDLQKIDAWLQSLTDDEMSLVCDGEETEVAVFMADRKAPEHTHGLLNDLFERI